MKSILIPLFFMAFIWPLIIEQRQDITGERETERGDDKGLLKVEHRGENYTTLFLQHHLTYEWPVRPR